MIVRDNGAYSSASDFDDETYAMLAANHVSNEDETEEHIGADAAERYESLVVRRVLSAQMEKAKQHQRHNLFHTKCVVMERSCHIIIDGGSYNNFASSEIVTKLGLRTCL